MGLFLSGGIDSASLLALMSGGHRACPHVLGGLHAAGWRTRRRRRDGPGRPVADHFGTDHHERSPVPAHRWWETLPEYVYYHDEPNANPSAVALDALARTIAAQVRVALNGTGGDELFGGYPPTRFPWVVRGTPPAPRPLPRMGASWHIWSQWRRSTRACAAGACWAPCPR